MDKRDNLIKAQKELIQMFDDWVRLIKTNALEEAGDVVKQSVIKRAEIANIEKTLKSKIITL